TCAESAEQALPLPNGGRAQHIAAFVPGGRIHPGVDTVGDSEVSRPTHQKARPRVKLFRRGHPLPRTFSCLGHLRFKRARATLKIRTWFADAIVTVGNSPGPLRGLHTAAD